jgi:hypothetical protein
MFMTDACGSSLASHIFPGLVRRIHPGRISIHTYSLLTTGNLQDDINYVTNSGTIKFTNWIYEKPAFILNVETPLAGLNVNSLLTAGSDAIQSYALDIFITASYFASKDIERTFNLSYPLSLREAHCGCCRWDSSSSMARPQRASARASSCPHTLVEYSTFFTTSKEVIRSLLVPQSCLCKHNLIITNAYATVRSSSFVISPGTSLTTWCGIWKHDKPLLLHALPSMSSAQAPNKHTELMKCGDPFPFRDSVD